jgi:hypothetical protein
MTGLDPQIHPPERVLLACPLGLRFLDVAIGAFVQEGLCVAALPPDRPLPQLLNLVRAGGNSVVNPSGVHTFHGLPGLRAFENSAADDPWNPPPATREFQVAVGDWERRFLPCTFIVRAPGKGLANLTDDNSPPSMATGAVPLFSAPGRAVPSGCAAVRAELRDHATARPAAWASVEAAYVSGGVTRIARGLADNAGRVALLFPYPEGLRRPFGASPPASGTTQEWTLSLSFAHAAIAGPEPVADYAIRLNQPPATASRATSPPGAVIEETLTLGSELNLGLIDLATV